MSAAASATRAFCWRRRSASAGSPCSCGHPVRWIEDRREHLTASANCREHHYRITGYADRDGRLLGIDCEATVDSGAYSAYPFSACLEAAQVASILPGPYDFPAYRCRTYSVATNKWPILPYRGVARTGVCFAIELVLDAIAREAGIEPHEVRAKNLGAARADAVHQHHQEDVRQRRLSGMRCAARWRRSTCQRCARGRQRGEADGRLIGVGFAIYCEQARARHLGLSRLGHSDGAGLRAGDRAADARRRAGAARRHPVARPRAGDDAGAGRARNPRHRCRARSRSCTATPRMTPYSTGTWGSRCMVMAGGAVSAACKEIAKRAAQDRRATAAGRRRPACRVRERRSGRPARHRSRSPRSRAPGTCGRRTCRPMSIRAGWR